MKTLYPEFGKPSRLEMERDFYAGEHFRFPGGGFTNRWMLPPAEYWLQNRSGEKCMVTVSVAQHLTELEDMRRAGLGAADDPAIVEWDFSRFCRLVDMRLLYCNRQKMTVEDLISLIRKTARIPDNVK